MTSAADVAALRPGYGLLCGWILAGPPTNGATGARLKRQPAFDRLGCAPLTGCLQPGKPPAIV